MSLLYRVLYRVGFTPWDTGHVPSELCALVEGDRGLPAGRALDIGCGTGTQALYLAQHGWQVTGIDDLEQPLARARDRAAAAGATAEFKRVDVTRLAEGRFDPGYTLMFDRGCFHGLSGDGRAAYAHDVTELAAPGAVMLMMAFAHNRIVGGPAGVDQAEVESTFGGWAFASAQPDSAPAPAGPLKNVPRTWYRLERR